MVTTVRSRENFPKVEGVNAAHWGVTDFYDRFEEPLEEALSRVPTAEKNTSFCTGWQTSKKSLASFCIWRPASRDGEALVNVEVKAWMDVGRALTHDALWSVFNEAGRKNTFRETEEEFMEEHEQIGSAVSSNARCHLTCEEDPSLEDVKERLREAHGSARESLDSRFEQLKAEVRHLLDRDFGIDLDGDKSPLGDIPHEHYSFA